MELWDEKVLFKVVAERDKVPKVEVYSVCILIAVDASVESNDR